MSMNLSAHIKEATRCKSMIFLFFKKRLASLIVQVVKNPPALQETPVPSLGCKDPLEEGMATHSSILTWRIPMGRGAWRATVHVVAKSWTGLSD